jgi:hypothetical protein
MLVDAPARQNASAMHISTSSRSNGAGGGLTDPRAAVSIHAIGKRVEGALFPVSGSSGMFLCWFGSLDPNTSVSPWLGIIKIVMIQ